MREAVGDYHHQAAEMYKSNARSLDDIAAKLEGVLDIQVNNITIGDLTEKSTWGEMQSTLLVASAILDLHRLTRCAERGEGLSDGCRNESVADRAPSPIGCPGSRAGLADAGGIGNVLNIFVDRWFKLLKAPIETEQDCILMLATLVHDPLGLEEAVLHPEIRDTLRRVLTKLESSLGN